MTPFESLFLMIEKEYSLIEFTEEEGISVCVNDEHPEKVIFLKQLGLLK